MCPASLASLTEARWLGPAAASVASVAQDAVVGSTLRPAVHKRITVADVAQRASHMRGVHRHLASEAGVHRLHAQAAQPTAGLHLMLVIYGRDLHALG